MGVGGGITGTMGVVVGGVGVGVVVGVGGGGGGVEGGFSILGGRSTLRSKVGREDELVKAEIPFPFFPATTTTSRRRLFENLRGFLIADSSVSSGEGSEKKKTRRIP